MLMRTGLAVLLAWCMAGCAEPQRPVMTTAHQTMVDSVRPIEVELARFRRENGAGEVRELDSPARSRDALVQAFVRALEQNDTAALRRLLLTPAEFAWLYYPYTVYTHAPYRQAPGMVWLLTSQNTRKGVGRLLERFGGAPLDVRGHTCARSEPQDLNVLHLECGVQLAGDARPRALFGTIIERSGRYKFVSYANDL